MSSSSENSNKGSRIVKGNIKKTEARIQKRLLEIPAWYYRNPVAADLREPDSEFCQHEILGLTRR